MSIHGGMAKLVHEPQLKRFILLRGEGASSKGVSSQSSSQAPPSGTALLALLEYERVPHQQYYVYDLYHTEVPAEMRGQGTGGELLRRVLEQLRAEDAERNRIVPSCTFVQHFLGKFPEFKSLVLPNNQ